MPSLADMERVLENLDRRLRGVEQLLPTLATKSDLESGLAQVLAFTEQVRDDVRSIAEGYGSLSSRVDSLSSRADSLSSRVDSVSGRLDSVSGRVDSLSGRVDSVSTDVRGVVYTLD